MGYTDAIRHLPRELLIYTKRTLFAADASCHFDDILEIETQEQLWALQQLFSKNAIGMGSKTINESNRS